MDFDRTFRVTDSVGDTLTLNDNERAAIVATSTVVGVELDEDGLAALSEAANEARYRLQSARQEREREGRL